MIKSPFLILQHGHCITRGGKSIVKHVMQIMQCGNRTVQKGKCMIQRGIYKNTEKRVYHTARQVTHTGRKLNDRGRHAHGTQKPAFDCCLGFRTPLNKWLLTKNDKLIASTIPVPQMPRSLYQFAEHYHTSLSRKESVSIATI